MRPERAIRVAFCYCFGPSSAGMERSAAFAASIKSAANSRARSGVISTR